MFCFGIACEYDIKYRMVGWWSVGVKCTITIDTSLTEHMLAKTNISRFKVNDRVNSSFFELSIELEMMTAV